MSYPPDPNNPYGQPTPPPPGYGYPQQAPPPAPGYGYPQQPPAQAPGYGAPGGYGIPQQQGPYGNAGQVQNAYAGWGSRVAAYFIDGLIAGLIPGILYIVAMSMAVKSVAASSVDTSGCTTDPNTFATTCPTPAVSSGMSGGALALMAVAGLVGFAATLFLLYREGTTGQTPGKKMVNIRVVREADGQVIGFGMAFVRRICHILDGFCCIGYLWPLWDAKGQTFADKIMGTVVVKSA